MAKLVGIGRVLKGARFKWSGEDFEVVIAGSDPVVKTNLHGEDKEVGNLSTFITEDVSDVNVIVGDAFVKPEAPSHESTIIKEKLKAKARSKKPSIEFHGNGVTISGGSIDTSAITKKQLGTETKISKLSSEVGKLKIGARLTSDRVTSVESKVDSAASVARSAQQLAGYAADEIKEVASFQQGEIARVSSVASGAQFAAKVAKEASKIQDDKIAEVSRRVGKLEVKNELTKTKEENSMNLQQKFAQKSQEVANRNNLQEKFAAKSASKQKGFGSMLNNFKGLFGKVEDLFAFSPLTGGLAVKKKDGGLVAYQDGGLTDVSGLSLDFNVPAFKLPVAAKDVKAGDVVLHNGEVAYVIGVNDDYLETIVPEKGSKGSVLPVKNVLFGQAFYVVVKTLDAAGNGGFDPMLLLALGDGNKDELLPLLLMGGGLGGNGAQAGGIDPMMLMMMGDKTDDLLPLILMQQGGLTGQGFNPLLFLLGDDKGSKKDLLPLLLMQQGGGLFGQAAAPSAPAVEVKKDQK